MRSFKARLTDAGLRADVFIAKQYLDYSRSSLDGLFERSLVLVDEKPVRSSYKIKAGDQLKVDDSVLFRQPEAIDLPIIYEDDDSIVIDKLAGVLTHSKGALNDEATVASFIKTKLSHDMPESNRAGIVHRLDRPTSGLVITAKNPRALHWLQKQFSTRKAKKVYLAIVEGELAPSKALIDAPIARDPRRPQAFRVNPSGKPAQTEYEVLRVLNKSNNAYSLVELRPLTGRTHQLRVHLAYIGNPIVGDRIYGHAGGKLYLHAQKLELTLPDGNRKKFESKAPVYFEDFISDV